MVVILLKYSKLHQIFVKTDRGQCNFLYLVQFFVVSRIFIVFTIVHSYLFYK